MSMLSCASMTPGTLSAAGLRDDRHGPGVGQRLRADDQRRGGAVMRPHGSLDRVVVVPSDADLRDAYFGLLRDDLRRAVVRDGGRFAGLLSLTDVARVLEAVVGSGRVQRR